MFSCQTEGARSYPTLQTTKATTRTSSTRVKRTEGEVEGVATPLEDLLAVVVEDPEEMEMEAVTHREDLLGSAAVVEVPEEMEVVTRREDLLDSVVAVAVPGEVRAASEVEVMGVVEVALEEVAAAAQEVTPLVDRQDLEVVTVEVVVSGVETVAVAEEMAVDSTAIPLEDQEVAVHQVLTCLHHESDEEKMTYR